MTIGLRIRKLRQQQHRTLDSVANQAAISRSMLSKIETGATMPAVATLGRLSAALGVSTSTLLDEPGDSTTVHLTRARMESAPFVKTDKGYSFFTFASQRLSKSIQPFLFVARKDEVTPHPLSHPGEQFIYVLEGSMRYRVGSVEYALYPGDSLFFDSDEAHDFQPISDEVRFLGVFSEHHEADRNKGKQGRSS